MSTLVISLLFLALGGVLGSFAGVVAERSYTGQSWKHGRSRCNACARSLTSLDMIPVVSWVWSGGRCRTCRARIPAGYLYIEFALALVFFFAYRTIGLTLALAPFLFAATTLAAIVLYDLRHMIVPPAFAAWFTVFSFGYALLAFRAMETFALVCAEAGAIALFFLLFYVLSNGRAMGLGDAPVAFGLSLLAGTFALAGLMFSFWIGAVVGIIILFGRPAGTRMGIEVPFVPFLAAGFLLATYLQWNPLSFIGF